MRKILCCHSVDMNNIKNLILQELKRKRALRSSDFVKKFNVTRQAINRHLSLLLDDGLIFKHGASKAHTFYSLNTPLNRKEILGKPRRFHKRVSSKNLSEDSVAIEAEENLDSLSQNLKQNFKYAFTEILNNAIEHAHSKWIDVVVSIDSTKLSFVVSDTGVGVFFNICQKKKLKDELEAIQDVMKGKLTTDPKFHSGEGLFFTSKVADVFVLESHRKRLRIDNILDDVFVEDVRFKRGTRALFEISLSSKKELAEIFENYTSEGFSFDKSVVKVKLFDQGGSYISRSQAKRLLHSLDKFKKIVLDFSGVTTVGQAFADEVFRVFQDSHPEIEITPVNCNENVNFMIKRAVISKATS